MGTPGQVECKGEDGRYPKNEHLAAIGQPDEQGADQNCGHQAGDSEAQQPYPCPISPKENEKPTPNETNAYTARD